MDVWPDGDSRWNSSIQVLAPFCVDDKLSSDFKIKFQFHQEREELEPVLLSQRVEMIIGKMDLATIKDRPAISILLVSWESDESPVH